MNVLCTLLGLWCASAVSPANSRPHHMYTRIELERNGPDFWEQVTGGSVTVKLDKKTNIVVAQFCTEGNPDRVTVYRVPYNKEEWAEMMTDKFLEKQVAALPLAEWNSRPARGEFCGLGFSLGSGR